LQVVLNKAKNLDWKPATADASEAALNLRVLGSTFQGGCLDSGDSQRGRAC
jgi:hypothetical protein